MQQRGIQLHGPFRCGLVDSRARKGAAARRGDALPGSRPAWRPGSAGKTAASLRRAARTGQKRDGRGPERGGRRQNHRHALAQRMERERGERAGIDKELTPALVKSDIMVTNTARIYGPNVADTAMALLLALTRGIAIQARADVPSSPSPPTPSNYWQWAKKTATARELHGKTMLIVWFGGIGTQAARRPHPFGMRVIAVEPHQ